MSERDQPATDVGAGYPEDNQPGTGIDPKRHAENDIDGGDDNGESKTARDGDPGQATGNPRAAGG
jgi:hypothetical protein